MHCLRLPARAACRAAWCATTSPTARRRAHASGGGARPSASGGVSEARAALDAAGASAGHAPHPAGAAPPPPPLPPLPPGLYVVATPIGNLHDLTPRAAAVLTGADCVLCEDTRHSGPLLARAAALRAALGPAGLLPAAAPPPAARPPLVSLHAHNEAARTAAVLDRLGAGQAVALISDAGTPLLSDPGGGLVAAAAAAGHAVTPVPGPCAAVAALSAAGLDAGDFLFLGFLPPKSAARRAALARVRGVNAAVVLYVPARSLAATLSDAAAALGPGRQCAVGRELTKRHEEWWRGGLAEGAAAFKEREGGGEGGGGGVRGEVTLVIGRPPGASARAGGAGGAGEDADGSPPPPSSVDAEAALISLLSDGVPPTAAAKALAKALGVSRAGLYSAAVAWKEEQQTGGRGHQ
jgi:16S rRNA (cytidine1402-2'-O)-methyltransferase